MMIYMFTGTIEALIEAVRQTPALWDKRAATYSYRRADKDVLWRQVATSCGSKMTGW